MKYLLLACFTLLLSNICFSTDLLKLVADNRVSPESRAITYALNLPNENSNAQDASGLSVNPDVVEELMISIKNYKNISEASYDAATNTITIVVNNSFSCTDFLQAINNLK